MIKVLVVDDDTPLRKTVEGVVKTAGFGVIEAENGAVAVEKFSAERPDVVLMDIKMPVMTGDIALEKIKAIDPSAIVIIMTAYPDVTTAVACMKNGAYDFIMKPAEYNRLVGILNRIAGAKKLESEAEQARLSLNNSLMHHLGTNDKIRHVIGQIIHVAKSRYSVIIQGETGTGKSVIAKTIHDIGERSRKPFVVVDIGSIPETLVESELFGSEKGAYTGADRKKKGYFEMANGGIIFIDEIHNIPLHTQAKILRAVEEKKVCPLGSASPIEIDVQVIVATNIDLETAASSGKFRKDLFYRLNEFMIKLPPLRERTDDIPFFAEKFLDDASEELNRRISKVDAETVDILKSYHWDGNIRELKNVIKRAALMSDSDTLDNSFIQKLIKENSGCNVAQPDIPVRKSLKNIEISMIKDALAQTGGNRKKAAEMLGMAYRTMMRKSKDILPD